MKSFHKQHIPQLARLLATIAALGAFVLGAASCGKPTRTTTQSSSSTPTTSGDATASASQKSPPNKGKPQQKKNASTDENNDADNTAIDFHNTLMDWLGAANKPLEKISKAMDSAVDDAHRDANPDNTRWQFLLMNDNIRKIPGYDLRAPDSFNSADREFFNKGIKTIRDSVTEVIAMTDSLNSYYQAEDYKDDWYKKLYMASLRFKELAATIEKTSDTLAERINDITEEIDNRNVAKIPVGKYVLNMRTFMKKFREMTACLLRDDLVDTKYAANVSFEEKQQRLANAKPWVEKAEALCAELDKLADSQRTLTVAGYENSRYAKMYGEFYSKYDGTKGDTRRILRELRERGVTNDQHNITSDQSDIGRVLGEFVDRWNDKASEGK